jgi:hypothetical protein
VAVDKGTKGAANAGYFLSYCAGIRGAASLWALGGEKEAGTIDYGPEPVLARGIHFEPKEER